jgi:hypothetical protein
VDKALRIINSLQKSGLIKAYAIGGGIAAAYYVVKEIWTLRQISETESLKE